MAFTAKQIRDLNNSMVANQKVSLGTLLSELSDMSIANAGAAKRYAEANLTIVAAATANDTAIVLPKGAIINAAYVVVATAEATGTTKTVDIGISGGDEDGILNGVSVAAIATVKGTLLSTGQTLGALMSVDEDGAGALVPEPYVCTAETTICYTLGSDDFAELGARVVIEYTVFE